VSEGDTNLCAMPRIIQSEVFHTIPIRIWKIDPPVIRIDIHCSHLSYVVQLLYLGKLSRHKNHKFSFKLLIFQMLRY